MHSSSHSQVVRDKRTGKTRGYGFVSFSNPLDLAAALKEMNGNRSFHGFVFFHVFKFACWALCITTM